MNILYAGVNRIKHTHYGENGIKPKTNAA